MSTFKEPTIEYLIGLKGQNMSLIAQLEENIAKYDEIMVFINENCDYTYATVDLINFYNNYSERAKEEIRQMRIVNKNIDEQTDKVCDHNFVTDIVDITPDRDQTVCYCTICELNKK
jgi:hypothetical protein